ncbi:MAG: hypothetical protein HKM89_00055 [Gemmatimonadales bacterium]|nr:hypothetical protein [Gemmatimonadales bacterium]
MKRFLKVMAFLILLLAIVVGWLYRDLVGDAIRRAVNPDTVSAVGRPDDASRQSARNKVRSLASRGVDSVVLNPSETASLLDELIGPLVGDNFDSLEVELLEGGIDVSGLVRTTGIPREMLGPLGSMVRPWERLGLGGPIAVLGAGKGEWRVERLSIKGFPFPRDMVAAVVSRLVEGSSGGAIPLLIPDGVVDFTIRPAGVTLYRRATAP